MTLPIRFSAIVLSTVLAAGLLFSSAARADLHQVIVRNFEFAPADLAITQGDTVRWVWESGFHTITSGLSSQPGDNPGALWDEPSTSGSPVFEYAFPNVGDVPYFCRPHELGGMTAIIRVQQDVTSVPGDRGDGNGPALITALAAFPNPFLSSVVIGFNLEREAVVALEIFDLRGRRIKAHPERLAAAGPVDFRWDGRDHSGRAAAAGIYFVRLRAGNETKGAKLFKSR